jgi:transcriptional regulator with XRE-family HTH domain
MRIEAASSDRAVLEEIGGRLRALRLDRNLSQQKLADEAGVGRVTVQRIEDGESASMSSLVRVLRALDALEALDGLLPPAAPGPIEELERRGHRRQRAGVPRKPSPPGDSWRWGDEEDEDRP